MTRRWQVLLGVVAVVVLGAGVLWLRELTETRHVPTPPDSRTLVELEARANLERMVPSMLDLVTAASTTCRIEIGARPLGPSPMTEDDGLFRTVLAPALDETEQTRYEGCLEDWRIDHLKLDVVTMRTWTPDG